MMTIIAITIVFVLVIGVCCRYVISKAIRSKIRCDVGYDTTTKKWVVFVYDHGCTIEPPVKEFDTKQEALDYKKTLVGE